MTQDPGSVRLPATHYYSAFLYLLYRYEKDSDRIEVRCLSSVDCKTTKRILDCMSDTTNRLSICMAFLSAHSAVPIFLTAMQIRAMGGSWKVARRFTGLLCFEYEHNSAMWRSMVVSQSSTIVWTRDICSQVTVAILRQDIRTTDTGSG